MRKKVTLIILGIICLGVACFVAVQTFLPKVVAEAIVSEEEIPSYVPGKIKKKIEKIKKPLNENAEAVISTMHKSGVTLEQVLKAIDNTTEDQVYAMLDEMNATQIDNIDQVFEMAKRHFPVDFDVEAFRKPYHEKVSMKLIKKGLRYANRHRRDGDIDPESARSIVKRILIQKEKKFNEIMNQSNTN
jgi:hypothetical protein